MADSSIFFEYQKINEEGIIHCLSKQRFEPYLKMAGFKKQYAFELYLYNARLAKACLFPLHIFEIILRNQISEFFRQYFCHQWPINEDFRNNILTKESKETLINTLNRIKIQQKRCMPDDVISGLTFDFWSNLFREEYDRNIWLAKFDHVNKIFPNNNTITRGSFQQDIIKVIRFRNRIAHHEPILKEDITAIYSLILKNISAISIDTHTWVKHYGTINTVLGSKPSASGISRSFQSMSDKVFHVVNEDDVLTCIKDHNNYFVCQSNYGYVVISPKYIYKYFTSLIDDNCLCIDLNDHKFKQIIDLYNLRSETIIVSHDQSFNLSEQIFRKKGQFIVTTKNDQVSGIVEKSHRRY